MSKNATIDKPKEKSVDAVGNRNPSADTSAKPITGENGEKLTGREAESYAVNAITRFVATFNKRMESLAKKDISLSETIGAMDNARSISNKATAEIESKKKEKEARALRTAMKEAQKALEEQLDELKKQIDAINKKIEALEEDISDTEKALRKEFGDDWKEKFKKDDVDKDNPLYQQWLLQQQQLDLLQRQRDELGKKIDDLSEAKDQIENDPTLSTQEKVERTQELLAEAKANTLWESRAIDRTEALDSGVIKEKELINPLQEKLVGGKTLEGGAVIENTRSAELNDMASSGFLAASMEGDGTYTKGIGEKGLSSQVAFNIASGISQDTNNSLKPEMKYESNETPVQKTSLTFTG